MHRTPGTHEQAWTTEVGGEGRLSVAVAHQGSNHFGGLWSHATCNQIGSEARDDE
jgi:hypothetical protein